MFAPFNIWILISFGVLISKILLFSMFYQFYGCRQFFQKQALLFFFSLYYYYIRLFDRFNGTSWNTDYTTKNWVKIIKECQKNGPIWSCLQIFLKIFIQNIKGSFSSRPFLCAIKHWKITINNGRKKTSKEVQLFCVPPW